MRIGLGYDIHLLKSGRPLKLGGVEIPFDKGSLGHSDGDCLYHAVTDALFGAAGLGDMGHHFPDTDPKWKDADSALFVKKAKALLDQNKWKIENLDANLHLESPKLAPHLTRMKENLSELLGIPADRINLKAKRGEGLDAVGRGEAVVCHVAVLLAR